MALMRSGEYGGPWRNCTICQAVAQDIGKVYGRYSKRDYNLARCSNCGYAFVTDPCQDLAGLYDDDYYDGRGADPLVDYGFELDHPEKTVRCYEWRGIARVVKELMDGISGLRWLDYGCGNGGLVRYLRDHHAVEASGLEEGSIARRAQEAEIPVLAKSDVEAEGSSFDVISAIEVLEHIPDPVGELRAMRRLLRPGGLLFLTTGNVRPHAAHLRKWSYVIPEIHISFFEPRTIDRALQAAGFYPEHRGLGRGFDEILTFKVLKNMRIKRRSALTDVLPRRVIGGMADRLGRLSEHPVGWAVGSTGQQAA